VTAVGDRFCHNRYTVVRKLGWGQFSTVLLLAPAFTLETLTCTYRSGSPMTKSESKILWGFSLRGGADLAAFRFDRHVALKIVKSARRFTGPALDEIRLLERIGPDTENVISLYDHFRFVGPKGCHIVMVCRLCPWEGNGPGLTSGNDRSLRSWANRFCR
jgi:serine/threonine-protein kinase SRPK3